MSSRALIFVRFFPPEGFNQFDLPEYTSYDRLRTQLLLAINECAEGFGFA